jgi:hypothetical protein
VEWVVEVADGAHIVMVLFGKNAVEDLGMLKVREKRR